MSDLSDTTITIPVRFDSTARVRNLKVVLRFLTHHFKAPILVCEEGDRPRAPDFLPEFSGRVGFVFERSESPYFHKTRCLNRLAVEARTPCILSHDTDVLAPAESYRAARTLLERGCHMAFPYDGLCLNVREADMARIWSGLSLAHLSQKNCPVYVAHTYGGAALVSREAFLEAGMENENFLAWGLEDNERVVRFSLLGYRIARVPGPLFHLEHPCPPGQIGTKNPHYLANEREYRRILGLSPQQLRAEVEAWPWRGRAAAQSESLRLGQVSQMKQISQPPA